MSKQSTYFSVMYDAFGGYSPGGRVHDGTHLVSRRKLEARGIDAEAAVTGLNDCIKNTEWTAGVKRVTLVE